MNATNFKNWRAKKITTNFPPQPVIVLDNSPCHCLQVDRPLFNLHSKNRHDMAQQEGYSVW